MLFHHHHDHSHDHDHNDANGHANREHEATSHRQGGASTVLRFSIAGLVVLLFVVTTCLVLVGPGLAAGGSRSHLYHPGHFHGFRKADPQARKQLRAADQAAADQRTAADRP